jgi:hypothetical protein
MFRPTVRRWALLAAGLSCVFLAAVPMALAKDGPGTAAPSNQRKVLQCTTAAFQLLDDEVLRVNVVNAHTAPIEVRFDFLNGANEVQLGSPTFNLAPGEFVNSLGEFILPDRAARARVTIFDPRQANFDNVIVSSQLTTRAETDGETRGIDVGCYAVTSGTLTIDQ